MLNKTAKLKVKVAEIAEVTDASKIQSAISCNNHIIQAGLAADQSLQKFAEIVAGIKKVAPRSDEFIYFVCRAIHSMEAANLDPVTGELTGDGFVNEAGRWVSPSGRVPFPYVNQNGDAFPESELLKEVTAAKDEQPARYAYHTFIGRGLFVNHASDDAEKIRGIILDATWDPKTKGVDLLVACDKIAYPELARQIQAGYSNDVSMGTQISHSVCSECGNVSKVEDDYCEHIRTAKGSFYNGRPCYEANFGLNFIEISVVATGADPKAKIRQVIAQLNKAVEARCNRLTSVKEHGSEQAKIAEANRMSEELRLIKATLARLASEENINNIDLSPLGIDLTDDAQMTHTNSHNNLFSTEVETLKTQLGQLQAEIKELKGVKMATTDRKAYFNDDGTPESGYNTTEQNQAEFKQNYQTVRDTQDKQMVGQGMESGNTGMHPGYGESDKAAKERLLRAEEIATRKRKREALLQSLAYFNDDGAPESGYNTTEQNQAEFKQNYQTVRDTQDKQMVGQGMESGNTGMHPGYGESDKAAKERLLRATKLKAKLLRKASSDAANHRWVIYAGEQPILEATAGELYGEDLHKSNSDNPEITNLQWVTSQEYGRNLIAAIRELGLEEVRKQVEAASKCSVNKDKLSDQTKDKKEDPKDKKEDPKGKKEDPKGKKEDPKGKKEDPKGKKEDPKSKAKGKTAKAQADLGGLEGDPAAAEMPAEGALDESAATSPEEGEEGAQVDINIDVDEGEATAGSELPADIASALSDVAEQIASVGEQLSSIIGGAEGEMDDFAETEALGEEVVETGEELTGLDDAMAAADEALDTAEEGSPEAEQAIEAKRQLTKLVQAAITDARRVASKGKKFLQRKAAKAPKNSLEARRAARKAIAEKLYDITDGDMTSDAHPKGNTTAVPGYEVKTGHGVADTSKQVATKNPTGKLTAAQKARRIKVASFIKAMEQECSQVQNEAKAVKQAPTVKAAGDPEAKAYWKELFNSDPEAKSFADDLAKDYSSRKAEDSSKVRTARMHKAYRVALRQAKLGQIQNSADAVASQVDTLMDMDDHGFEAFAKAVETTALPMRKAQASATAGSTLRAANAQIPPQGEQTVSPQAAALNAKTSAINDLAQRLGQLDWSVRGRR